MEVEFSNFVVNSVGETSSKFCVNIVIFIRQSLAAFEICSLEMIGFLSSADPNTHIIWLESAVARLKALRAIQPGTLLF